MTSFPFIVAAVVSQFLLGFIRPLSVALQGKSCDLLRAFQNANNMSGVAITKDTFRRFFNKAENIATKLPVVWSTLMMFFD